MLPTAIPPKLRVLSVLKHRYLRSTPLENPVTLMSPLSWPQVPLRAIHTEITAQVTNGGHCAQQSPLYKTLLLFTVSITKMNWWYSPVREVIADGTLESTL